MSSAAATTPADGRQPTRTAVTRAVRNALAAQLERPPATVRLDMRLRDDLGVDSVVALAVLEELQLALGVAVDLRRLARHARGRTVDTVADLRDVVLDFFAGRLVPPDDAA